MKIKNLKYTKQNILKGAIIYSTGDTIATFLVDEFSIYRLLGIVFIGATFYAFEIPNYFTWIDKKTTKLSGISKTLTKANLAVAYFNPIWIFRHLAFIKLFSGNFNQINFHLLEIASFSFMINIPISFLTNYMIQNKVKLEWRFIASAIFSAITAIYYALSETIFN